MKQLFAAAALMLAALATPAAADPSVEAVRSHAARIGPVAFERTADITDRGGKTVRRVDRFTPEGRDGRGNWVLVSIDGRPPTDRERRDHAREVGSIPAPGYWRLETLLSGPFTTARDGAGQTVYRFQPLARGSIQTQRGDISQNLAAEARIETVGGQPVVRSIRIFAPEPFGMMGVAPLIRAWRAEWQSAHAGSLGGRIWLFAAPVLQLGLYAFLFG
ncbi:MAG: hypothetical protein ACK4TG_10970, partial [Thermaurantiacus sp.]